MTRIFAWVLPPALSLAVAATAGAQATKTAPAPKAGPPAATKSAPAPAPVDPAAQKAAQARTQGQMEHLLDEWEKQSSKVRSLQVVFERVDTLPKWGDKYYQGLAFLQSPDLACLEFRLAQVDQDGKPIMVNGPNGRKTFAVEKEPAERIVCNGSEVLQFMWDIREVYRYPLNREAREKALQQGPLPFLFNMKAAEAKQRYSMTLLELKDPAQAEKYYLIRIVPRQEIDQKSFRDAYIYLSRQTFMPDRLILLPVGQQERQDFRFTTIVENKAIPATIFNPDTNIKGWKIVDNPDANASPKGIGASPAAQPARGGQAPAVIANPVAPRRNPTQAPPR